MTKGLTAYQIKWIAVFFMTLDHLAAYGFEIKLIRTYSHYLRIVGRIAAPLFLFIVVESTRHTRNQVKYILRLYIAGVLTGLFQTITNFFLGNIVGTFLSGNILFTFFYTVLYIYLTNGIFDSAKKRNIKKLMTYIIVILFTIIPSILFTWFFNIIYPSNINFKYIQLSQDLWNSFIPAVIHVEYSYIFIILGIVLYFAKTKYKQCLIYGIFCFICLMGSHTYYLATSDILFFQSPQQPWMILALPFMLLYNQERGKSHKYFFYIYYPVHRYIISILAILYLKLTT